MPTYPVKLMIDSTPTFEIPVSEILAGLKLGGALKVLSPVEYHTYRQIRWYKGIALRTLSDWSGDTPDEWDLRCKALCNGNELLKKETVYLGDGKTCIRLTTVGTSKKNFTAFIQNILSKAIELEWPLDPPDENLRT